MKTLAIITDYTIADWLGGGTLVNEYIRNCARSAGWNVLYLRVNPQVDEWSTASHRDIDAYFVGNIPYFPGNYIVELINSKKNYVVFRHDVASVCYLERPQDSVAAKILTLLFGHSKANFFVSYLQLGLYRKIAEIPRVYVIPPPIDLNRFSNGDSKGRYGQLYLGEISAARGIEETIDAMKSYEDFERGFFGQLTDVDLGSVIINSGANLWPVVAHEKVPELMNRFRVFHYHPRIIDAFCLKIVEAELCGLLIDVRRENVGRYSFGASAIELRDFMSSLSPELILSKLDA